MLWTCIRRTREPPAAPSAHPIRNAGSASWMDRRSPRASAGQARTLFIGSRAAMPCHPPVVQITGGTTGWQACHVPRAPRVPFARYLSPSVVVDGIGLVAFCVTSGALSVGSNRASLSAGARVGGLRDSQRQPPAVPYEPRGGHRPTVLRELRFACREAALCRLTRPYSGNVSSDTAKAVRTFRAKRGSAHPHVKRTTQTQTHVK